MHTIPFLLILLLLLLNLLFPLLHCLDIKHKQEGKLYAQKEEALKTFFPDPSFSDHYLDFFANGPISKQEMLAVIKVGLTIPNESQADGKVDENGFQQQSRSEI